MVFQRLYRSCRPVPLRWVVLLSLVTEVVLLAAALSWLSCRHNEQTATTAVEDLGERTAGVVREKVRNYFEQPELLLQANQAIAQSGAWDLTAAGVSNRDQLRRLLWKQVQLSSAARTLYYTDIQGNFLQVEQWPRPKMSVRTSATAPDWQVYALTEDGEQGALLKEGPFDPRDRPWFRTTVQRQQLTWSGVYRFQDPQVLGLTVSVPVRTATGEIRGVLSADLSLDGIGQFLQGLPEGKRVQVAIVQRNGMVVATSRGDRSTGAQGMSTQPPVPLATADDPWLAAAGQWLKGEMDRDLERAGEVSSVVVVTAADGESLLVQRLPLGEQRGIDWQLVMVAPETDFRGGLEQQSSQETVMWAAGAIALALVVSLWLVNRQTYLVRRVSEAAAAIIRGNLAATVAPSAIAEANTLTDAFNRMVVQLLHSSKAWEEANQYLELMVEQRTAAVRQSEEKFAKMFRSSPNPIVISTCDEGRIVDANDCFFEMLQYIPDEVVGFTAQELDLWLHWGDREAIVSELREHGMVQSREVVFRSRWGDHHILLLSAEFATLDNQLCILWAGNDITEQKQSEAALREKEEYLRSILDSIPQHVFWKDVDLNFLGCNRNWAEAAGLSDPAAVIGKTDYDLIPNQDAAAAFRLQDRTIIETGEPIWHTVAPKVKAGPNGETRWLDISKIPIQGTSGEVIGILGVIDDITLRKQAEEALKLEKERSERLLLNILPHAIANQLKESASLNNPEENNQPIAHNYEFVSILFADIVGFTELSAELTPIQLVDWLNRLFSEFDRLAEQYQLEKIKTIGDAYMVAAGLPTPIPHPVEAIANMALEMRETTQALEPEFMDKFDRPLNIRIGINSGPVIAGVIGIKKFIYDLWGDTVNIASRMESHGEPGQIQVTEATYQAIAHQFLFDERGEIEVKGRGPMTTYWLRGRRLSCALPLAD